jgi:hypothetical protein
MLRRGDQLNAGHRYPNGSQALGDAGYPVVLPQRRKREGNGFVERRRRHFDRVTDAFEIGYR